MYQNIRKQVIIWQPAAVGSGGTISLLQVKKGDILLRAISEKQILSAGTTSIVDVGDTGDPDGIIAALDLDAGAVGDLASGAGAYVTASGKLFTANGTIDAVYTPGATPGATNPRVKFTFYIMEAGL